MRADGGSDTSPGGGPVLGIAVNHSSDREYDLLRPWRGVSADGMFEGKAEKRLAYF